MIDAGSSRVTMLEMLDMSSNSRTSRLPQPVQYIACYVLWIALSALGFTAVLSLRDLLLELVLAVGANQWVYRAIDRWSLFLIGIAWLGGVIYLETYLRRGVERGGLGRRAVRASVITVVLAGGLFVLNLLVGML